MSGDGFFDPQGRRKLGDYSSKQGASTTPYELVGVWEFVKSSELDEPHVNEGIYPPKRGYNRNDARGGFNDKGESLVYHPDHYDPSAASLLLMNIAGTFIPIGRIFDGAVVIVKLGRPLLNADRVLFGNANRAIWTGETVKNGTFITQAGRFANELGYHTLEQTNAGVLTYLTTKGMESLRINPTSLWIKASSKYASGAGDIVPAIINAKTGIKEGGVFIEKELPIILEKGSKVIFYVIW